MNKLEKFPIPPSANNLYAWARSQSRMVKTKAYRDYETSVTRWIAKNADAVRDLRGFFRRLKGQVIRVDATFVMPLKEVVTKDGRPKKNDTSNRLKALHDVLSDHVIGVDDSYFWCGSFDKAVVNEAVGHVDVVFELINLEEIVGHGGDTRRDDDSKA